MTEKQVVRLAAVGDLHVKKTSQGAIAPLLAPVNEQADVLLLCGDLTDYGLPEEAGILAKELSGVRIPMIGVLGNHDFESGQQGEVCRILSEAGGQDPGWRGVGDCGHWVCGNEGFSGWIRPRHIGRVGRARRQTLRAGGDR